MVEEYIFTPIKSEHNLVHRVVEELQRLIFEGELKPDTHLPSQTVLALRMGVSRTVIREATGILVTKGLLESKHGVGTIVREIKTSKIIEPLDILLKTKGITLDDLYQVRSIIEIEIAGLAAKEANDIDLAELHNIVDKMMQINSDSFEYIIADDEFHRTLAKMSRNPLLVMLSDSIRDLMHEVRLAVSSHPELTAIAKADHSSILECVKAKDIIEARRAMKTHLDNARRIQEIVLSEKESAQGQGQSS